MADVQAAVQLVAPQGSAKTAGSQSEVKPSPLAGPTAKMDINNSASSGSRSKNKNNSSQSNSPTPSIKSNGFLSLLLCCTSGAGSFLDNNGKSTRQRAHVQQPQQQQQHLGGRKKKNTTTITTTSTTVHNNSNNDNNSYNVDNSDADGREGKPHTEARLPSSSSSSQAAENITDTSLPDVTTGQSVSLPKIVTNPNELALIQAREPSTGQQREKEEDGDITAAMAAIPATPRSPPPQSPEGSTTWFLPPLASEYTGRKCLVLDLDETLVHSSFKVISNPDFVVPIEIDNQFHNVYVLKRPGVDEFMRKMGELYEIVVFTASLSKYADPVLDVLDIHNVVKHRLFRESCHNHKGMFVKDLSQLGRELSQTLILDNSPASYIFHTANAVPVSTWFSDPHDTELADLAVFLKELKEVDDVTLVLDLSR